MADAAHATSLLEPIVLLATAVVAVPLAKRLGLGSVLGYIAAGIAIGPFALGLFAEPGRVSGIAELGIVLLLFLIGLELNLRRLWALRRDIFGLGTAQVVVSGAVITLYPLLVAGRSLPASIIAGLGLALSSTAIVMQMLEERGEVDSPHGRTAFAVLLLQDLAIVPLIALVGFLSPLPSVDLGVVAANGPALVIAVCVLTVTKTAVMYALGRLFGHDHATSVRAGLLLSQGGEFGFVLYSAAAAAQVMTPDHASLLVALVTLSMILSPFVARLAPVLARPQVRPEPMEDYSDARGTVLVIGFGRVGQVLAQVLLRRGVRLTIIDPDVEQIEAAARFGARIYYGDGTRLDVLRAAGAARVQLIAVCTDRPDVTDRIVSILKESFPDTPCVVRSFDRRHSLQLLSRGLVAVRETFESALVMGREALVGLGVPRAEAEDDMHHVRARDMDRLQAQLRGEAADFWDRYRIRPEPLETPSQPR
jgi:Kef-type K+ transport system membrane component KefB/voltage-gated potassium channel Kch